MSKYFHNAATRSAHSARNFFCSLVLILVGASSVWADNLVGVASSSALGASDSVQWSSQLGANGSALPASFSVHSQSNNSVGVTLAGSYSIAAVVCGTAPCSWVGSGFAANDKVLWTSDLGNGGNGPVTLSFTTPIAGAGALIQADGPAQFTAQIQAYNQTTLLGTYAVTSDSNGDATYVGILDQTASSITSVVFSVTSCLGNCADFAIDSVGINVGGSAQASLNKNALSFTTTGVAQPVTLTNNGSAALSISSIVASAGFSVTNTCNGSVAANGGSCSISVTWTNTQDTSGSVTITDNAGNSPQTITLTGNSNSGGTGALLFVPITPCRVADTRTGQGFTGAFGPPEIPNQGTRNFPIQSSACNIPTTALAYSLNITAVPDASLAYLTVWPQGQNQPTVSTLNSDGRIKANAAIVPAGGSGTNGGVSVYAYNSTNVILDIDGYFVPVGTSGALSFYPLTPCRLVDTRSSNGTGPLAGPSLTAQVSRSFPIKSTTNACSSSIPANAQAYSLNVTALPSNGSSLLYLTTWPTGATMPNASTLNATTGTYTANAAIVPASGTNGAVSVYAYNNTDLLIDINGYFAPSGGSGALSLYTVTPCRALDTRNPPAYNAPPFSGELTVNIVGSSCGVPASAQAFVLNATVVPPGPMIYLTLWPDGHTEPTVSTLNAIDGATTSNMAIVPTTNGSIDAFAYNATQLLVDISSYFAP